MNGVGGFRIPEPQAQPYPPTQASHSHIAHHWAVNSRIEPGTITYTTTTNADGQVTNYPFRAVPVSYQTSQGIVHDLQWVPADTTQVLLTDAQLPNTGLAAGSFGLDLLDREDDVVFKKWFEQIPHFTSPGEPDPISMAAYLSFPRGRSPYSARASFPMPLPKRFPNSCPPSRAPSPYQRRQQSRSPHPSHRTPSLDVRTHPRAPSPDQNRRQSRSHYPSLHRTSPPHAPSPYVEYPHGHALEGQPILGPPSSHMPIITFDREPMSDSSPHPFTRLPDATQAYTPFSIIRIQGMDQFSGQIPSMPSVLDTHDVHHQDWSTFMNNISLAWMEKLPLPEFARGCPPPRSSIVADVINLWNNSFFLPRQVEVVLYKGCERRSGRHPGTVDHRLSLPESERDNEREQEYSLYLTCATPGVDDLLESTRAKSYATPRYPTSSYAYYL